MRFISRKPGRGELRQKESVHVIPGAHLHNGGIALGKHGVAGDGRVAVILFDHLPEHQALGDILGSHIIRVDDGQEFAPGPGQRDVIKPVRVIIRVGGQQHAWILHAITVHRVVEGL